MKYQYQEKITAAIREHGPMTVMELAEELKADRHAIATSAWRMSSGRLTRGKMLYVHSWRLQPCGTTERHEKVFAIGNRPDATKPKAKTVREINQAYNAKAKSMRSCISIFHMGLSVTQLRELTSKRAAP